MARRFLICPLFACLLLATGLSLRAETTYEETIRQARQQRLERLQAPEGWLSLVALHWLKTGETAVGSGPENGLRLPGGPAQCGRVELDGAGRVRFTCLAEGVTADGKPVAVGESIELNDDLDPERPALRVRAGTISFHLIDRAGRKGLRARHTEAETRVHFLGLDYFPLDPNWRVVGRWVPFAKPQTRQIRNILGQSDTETVCGEVVFSLAGREVRLLAIWDGDPKEKLFFVISDETSGHETYSAARFVYANPPEDGTVVVDFNLAVNPPCAFTPFATCPLPPEQNQLPFPVRAGEKRYRGEPAH